MKIIETVLIDDVINPSEPIPAAAIHIVCDGETYTVYEEGDEIPAEFVSE
jgi:hypothetical protein